MAEIKDDEDKYTMGWYDSGPANLTEVDLRVEYARRERRKRRAAQNAS